MEKKRRRPRKPATSQQPSTPAGSKSAAPLEQHPSDIRADSDPYIPVFDKPPGERTPGEIKDAIEGDAVLERHGQNSR